MKMFLVFLLVLFCGPAFGAEKKPCAYYKAKNGRVYALYWNRHCPSAPIYINPTPISMPAPIVNLPPQMASAPSGPDPSIVAMLNIIIASQARMEAIINAPCGNNPPPVVIGGSVSPGPALAPTPGTGPALAPPSAAGPSLKPPSGSAPLIAPPSGSSPLLAPPPGTSPLLSAPLSAGPLIAPTVTYSSLHRKRALYRSKK